MTIISTYEAERWRQLSDELTGQADRVEQIAVGGTAAEWQALQSIRAASRHLFNAFALIARDRPLLDPDFTEAH